MASYPTPPLTSSPKHNSSQQPVPSYRPLGKIPAQESYFHSYSAPSSPIQSGAVPSAPFSAYPEGFDPSQPPPQPQPQPQRPPHSNAFPSPSGVPPRRRSSPTPYSVSHRSPYPKVISPRPFSPRPFSPRPLHFSPKNPVPSPYSASRPQPRPGFVKWILGKIEGWIKAFMRWTKRNPISAGLVTFIPVLATAGVMKIARGVGKGLGIVNKGYGKDGLLKGTGKAEDGKEEAKSFGHGLDESIGFGGAKKDAGPLEGILKTVQGWV